MKRCRLAVEGLLVSCCAAIGAPAFAQSAAPARGAAVEAPKMQTVNASARGAKTTVAAVVTVAGSVIVLADGIVANATMAQIQPPADGFVYER